MKLSKRLNTIYDQIDKTKNIIDVGCDHGLLDIKYVLETSNKALATDISENAISSAKKNALKENVLDKIDFMVTDGLNNIKLSNEDIIISGMGSHTIINILNKNINNRLIISTHKDIPYLRKKLVEYGYKIESEIAVFDKKMYVIITFIKGNIKYNETDYLIGPYLKSNKTYINYLLDKETKIKNKSKIETELYKILINLKNTN